MDGNHPNNIDPRPKRRRDKDNPYHIFTVGADTEQPRYYLSFRDGQGRTHSMEISAELFHTFDRFELDDLSFLNEFDNHYEHSELTEASLHARASCPAFDLEESTMRQFEYEALYAAIQQLPGTQRHRLIMYYFDNMTLEEIGKAENCTHQAVRDSIKKAYANLKKYLL
ncbi:MAG: sigma-70 family RNA polymerase sigma factor [Oscillospiraceae bacterium]|nr:sigma-70 family RNA polymerase sigma factor [Oscillospiraceae bacterium]